MTFDVHAHVVPAGIAARLRGMDASCGVSARLEAGRLHLTVGARAEARVRPELLDIDARLAAMDASGVDVQLLSAWIPLVAYDLPADQGAAWSRVFNDALAATVDQNPQRFRGLANVPLQDGEAAAGELVRAIRQLGMVGTQIATSVGGRHLDDDSLEDFWATAERLRCLVVVHPDQRMFGSFTPRYLLSNFVGNAAETTFAAAHIACGGVLERHPDLRICLVHGGGNVPCQAPRLDHGYESESRLTDRRITRPPSRYLRRMYYDTVTHSPDLLEFLVTFAGHRQVLVGSDYPFEMGERDPLGLLRRVLNLEPDQQRDIAEGNVARLLSQVRHEES